MKLKEGLVKFLDEMCNGKSIDRNIMKRICIPASNIGKFVKTLILNKKILKIFQQLQSNNYLFK